LLRKAARRVSQIYDEHLAPFGLTITQYGLLAHLAAFDGINIGALAEKLIMDPTTLSRNLRPLIERGFVTARADARDRRTRNLHLTRQGRTALEKARPGWLAAQQQIETRIGSEQRLNLVHSVDHVLDSLK
jgi:DNA-binding MarR family transcriptional regulator